VPAKSLEATGRFENHFIVHKESEDRWGPKVENLDGMDVLVIQRAAITSFEAWITAAKKAGIPVVYETDDDLFNIAKHNPVYDIWHKQRHLTRKLMERCDHIVVSTPPLKEAIGRHTDVPPDRITIGFNHLHPDIWGTEALAEAEPVPNGEYLYIGWQGSTTHDVDFQLAAPALGRVCEDFPQVRLRFFGHVPKTIHGHVPPKRFEWAKPVTFGDYPRNLRRLNFDIGIAPVTESKFNQSKSNLKFLEYAALKVPTVASKVWPYARTIKPSTGFVAATTEDWYEALATLIQQPALRATLGQAAYDDVWANWGHTTRAQPWIDLFDRLAEDRDARKRLSNLRPAGESPDRRAA
jgi:glycosyltransferase involved in cell wall biosynthesis